MTYKTAFHILKPRKSNFLSIVERAAEGKGQAAIDRLTLLLRNLLTPFATHRRGYVQAVLKADR
ncbi:MAG: hypothetical protein NT047_10275 [Deltaproteobacteria bacterium]|nr:hypothetical protein [Deltaproteobacteria bacterium]